MIIDSPRSVPTPAANLDQGPSSSQPKDTLQNEDRETAGDTATEAKKVRNIVPKAAWVPNSQSVSVMEIFKNEVSKFDISSLKKTSPYPTVLEQPLLDLHKEILAHNDPKELNRTTGYYEFISSCLGSHFPVGRIKTNIARLQAKANCSGMKAHLLGLYQSFCRDLSTAIIPCPEDKKFLKPKDKKEVSTSVAGEEPDASAEQMLVQQQEPSEEKEPEASAPTSDGPSPAVVGAETIEFVWYCKWNLQLRQRLVELLDFCVQWANAENDYRGKLVLADKKDMSPDQYVELISAVEQEKIIDGICSIFPKQCLDGDRAAVKKAIKTERARVKRGVSGTASKGHASVTAVVATVAASSVSPTAGADTVSQNANNSTS
eukprot:gene933-671_t